MPKILILGGGASGLAAAIQAAEHGQVTLLERQNRVGRKLLATGNGRCNLSNTGAGPERYHGADPDFCRGALAAYPPERVLEFFHGLGLRTVTEYGGRVYPRSDHASSVLDVLRLAAERRGVALRCGCSAERIERRGRGFRVLAGDERVDCDLLIAACGGCAGGKLGGVMDGYRLLGGLGHSRTALFPALTTLRCQSDYPKALKGIRVDCEVSLRQGGRRLAAERGDVLFTEPGLSGTAVFAVSRTAAAGGEGLTARLDLFPEETREALTEDLRQRRERFAALPANEVLVGAVQSRLGMMLSKAAGISGGVAAGSLTDAQIQALAATLKGFDFPIRGVGGFEAAQVTAGGLNTKEFDANTMQSRLVPGLYACGELLDVDGDCGGFNLQWAWASGLLAGELR